MSTYVDLRNRIIDEMTNDGALTTTQVNYAIADAIKKYERRPFWFNQAISTFSTVSNQEYYTSVDLADISTMVQIVSMTVTNSSVKGPVRAVSYQDIDDLQDGSVISIPRMFAYFTESIRLYPIPDAVYTVTISFIERFAALSADADTNAWTNEAEDLIRAAAKRFVAINYFHADDIAARVGVLEAEALGSLMAEDRRRRPNTTLRVPSMLVSKPFNITIG